MHLTDSLTASPGEVFPMWRRAQLEVERRAREDRLPPGVLRTTALLAPELAERVADWFLGPPTASPAAVRHSYAALEREAAELYDHICGLGVRVRYVHTEDEPYASGAELCAELRAHGTMTLRTIACEAPHPLLDSSEGGVVDQLRAVHDVFGHAALGLGFDLQSEYGTWLQCKSLFSQAARPAAFTELVGAVTAYVVAGEKPPLRADLPPLRLLVDC